MLNLPHFGLVVTTLMLLFQKLKGNEMIENAAVGASSKKRLEGAVDLEVTRITSKNVTTSDGLGATENVLGETSDGANHEGAVEV
jgi:hypothetical protein